MKSKAISKSIFNIANEHQMQQLGASLSLAITAPCRVNLMGNLGAGKTTFARGFVRATGFEGLVKSPTYTLVEPYELPKYYLYHIDLYRLSDPEELEFLGLREMLELDSVLLVEWPEKGKGVLPAPDIEIEIKYAGEGRVVGMSPVSDKGREVLSNLEFQEQQ